VAGKTHQNENHLILRVTQKEAEKSEGSILKGFQSSRNSVLRPVHIAGKYEIAGPPKKSDTRENLVVTQNRNVNRT
jgi:hypothetical protein